MKYIFFLGILSITLNTYAMETTIEAMSDLPLYQAVERNELESLRSKILKGAEVNEFDKRGSTALHYVKSLEAAQILVAHNAQSIAEQTSLATPLHSLVQRNTPECRDIVSFLLSKGAAVNAKNKFGFHPLDLVDWSTNPYEMVKILLENKAEIKYAANGKQGHLDLVIFFGDHTGMAELLLTHGCDPKKITFDSKWFLDGKIPGCDRSGIAALLKRATDTVK